MHTEKLEGHLFIGKAMYKRKKKLALRRAKSTYLLIKITILSDLLCKGLFLDLASYWVAKPCCRDMCNAIVSLQSFQNDEHFQHLLKSQPLGACS